MQPFFNLQCQNARREDKSEIFFTKKTTVSLVSQFNLIVNRKFSSQYSFHFLLGINELWLTEYHRLTSDNDIHNVLWELLTQCT